MVAFPNFLANFFKNLPIVNLETKHSLLFERKENANIHRIFFSDLPLKLLKESIELKYRDKLFFFFEPMVYVTVQLLKNNALKETDRLVYLLVEMKYYFQKTIVSILQCKESSLLIKGDQRFNL